MQLTKGNRMMQVIPNYTIYHHDNMMVKYSDQGEAWFCDMTEAAPIWKQIDTEAVLTTTIQTGQS